MIEITFFKYAAFCFGILMMFELPVKTPNAREYKGKTGIFEDGT